MGNREVGGAGIGNGDGLRVGDADSNIGKRDARRHNGNGGLHAGAAESDCGRVGGVADDGNAADVAADVIGSAGDNEREALPSSKINGSGEAAHREGRAAKRNTRDAHVGIAGVVEQKRVRGGGADQDVTEGDACGARVEQVCWRGRCGGSSAGYVDRQTAAVLETRGEGDRAGKSTRCGRNKADAENSAGVAAEDQRQRGTADGED